MKTFIQSNGQLMQELQKSTMINSQAIQEVKNATMVNTQAIVKIESQIGQIANHLGEREKGTFPSQPVPNPKALTIKNSSNSTHRHEQVQSIVRSGKQVDSKVGQEEEDHVEPQGKESGGDKGEEAKPSRAIPTVEEPQRSFVPKAPYPEKLRAPKKNAQFAEILEVFKQVQINIPFFDAIQQVPSYVKFLKDLVTVKRKNNIPKKAFLTEQVSSILQYKLPIKYKDPGFPTISCRIGTN
jgi:hypothetical protein